MHDSLSDAQIITYPITTVMLSCCRLTEAEIDVKVAELRIQLRKADEVTPESQQQYVGLSPITLQVAAWVQSPSSHQYYACRLADETHAIAKRKLSQMAKLRDVFGFTAEQDNKEGEAFDRELQEQRKRDRLMEQELREKAKVKEARKRAKEVRHTRREEKRAIKKAEKQREKDEKARIKVCSLLQVAGTLF